MNKLQWNFNQNSNIFIHENVFQSVVFVMAAILSGPECVKLLPHHLSGQWVKVDGVQSSLFVTWTKYLFAQHDI